MKKSLSGVILLTLIITLFSSQNSIAQETAESGLGIDCFDPSACNYSGFIPVSAEPAPSAGFGFEICIYPQWYYPDTVNGTEGPAVLSCEAPQGYLLASQECIINVLQNDTFCYITEWDLQCEREYENCVIRGIGCGDASACNYDEDALHPDDDEYCKYEAWYLPIDYTASSLAPVIFACSAPVDYYYAHQCCVEYALAIDAYCVTTDWDGICEGYYDDCLTTSLGCTNPDDCNYDASACVDDGTCADVHGCTYKDACNYFFAATEDDGSCEFPGCTDPDALNWDPFALCGEAPGGIIFLGGTVAANPLCVYPEEVCYGDFDNNGTITAADLAAFLGVYGTECITQGPL